MYTIANNTPANFKQALEKVKARLEANPLPNPFITINAWNEWTEGSYLEPDKVSGMKYLEAIRDVFLKPEASNDAASAAYAPKGAAASPE